MLVAPYLIFPRFISPANIEGSSIPASGPLFIEGTSPQERKMSRLSRLKENENFKDRVFTSKGGDAHDAKEMKKIGAKLVDSMDMESPAQSTDMVSGLVEKMQDDQSLDPALVLKLTRAIKSMDTDGDGNIGADEIIHFVMKEVAGAQKLKKMKTYVMMLAGFIVFLLLGNFGLSISVVYLTKQMEVQEGGVMVDNDGNVVQTASSDFAVDSEGKMVVRAADGDDGAAQDQPLRTAPASKERPLSSRVPDEYIRQVRSVRNSGAPPNPRYY